MKYKLCLFFLVSLLSNSIFSQNIPSYVPTNGLVGWWPFNGNANDESGNGNHGTVNGATLTSDRNGNTGKAYSFNGIPNRIEIGNNLNPNSSIGIPNSSWSASAWINKNNYTGTLAISDYNSIAGNTNPGENDLTLSINLQVWQDFANVGLRSNGNDYNVSGGYISNNLWHHIAFTAGNNILKLYVDGILVGQTSYNSNLNFYESPFYRIGSSMWNGNYGPSSGKIDDIAIYNRALTQQEITALYNGPTYTITASSGSNGSITPSGITTLNSIGTQRYTYTAYSGYMVDSVIVDGNKVDSISGYTFSSLTSNHTIRVTYKALNIPSYVPTNGLVGWWPFNGNANDESGNGNNGVVNGATLINDRKSNANKAYSFDGINDWIEINNFSFSNSNSYSISCWVQLNVAYSSGYPQHYIWDNGVISNGLFLNLDADLIQFSCQDFNTNVPIGSWHNYLTTVENNQIKLYFDGNLVKTTSCNMTMLNNRSLKFGTSCINTEYTNGLIDDIAIYNRALSQAEISALYSGSFNIIASSGANGSISPSGTTSVNSGSSQTYTFTPNSGYWIDSVIVNGVQVPTASSYTFNNVTSNQSIRVTYRSLAAALAAANICSNDTLVSTVNLPSSNFGRATVYYSNIFLFGGTGTNNAHKYNVNDRKYTAIANKPSPCIECGVAEANGKVYCFNTNGTSEAYDIATNTWQNQMNQPSASSSSVYAASINNKIYVLGTNNNQNTFTQYNPQTNSYTALTNPTTSSSQSRLVAFNNKLYKIGGADNNNQALASVEVYNPANNTWTAMPDLPVALTQVGATHYDNKLYVFGGKQANNSYSNKVYVFDFTSNAWYLESNTLNEGRSNIEAKTANNMVFLFAGNDSTYHTSNQALRYFCKDQLCTCKWAEYVCNGVSSDVPCPTSSLYRPGTVFCNGYATKVVDVTNPITGRTWMDRNLGAQRAATSSTDTLAYGDLYQWGRGADGHQCRNSATINTLSTNNQPMVNFITALDFPNDWRSTQNDNLWQGVNGVNNPCPSGYRIPTNAELDTERTSWSQNNSLGTFNSQLKFPLSGARYDADGSIYILDILGMYWSSSVSSTYAWYLCIDSGVSLISNTNRAYGFSIRCIKD